MESLRGTDGERMTGGRIRGWRRGCGILLLALLACPAAGAQVPGKKHVLLLQSYHRGMQWTDRITEGVERTLAGHPEVELQVVHMDTKRVSTPKYFAYLRDYYEQRFSGAAFDVVIAADDNAFNFAMEHRGKIFPGAALVFCGVNYFTDDRIAGLDDVTGVVEAFDIGATLEAALRLHPQAKRLAIINDRTTTGEANRKVIEGLLPGFSERVAVEFLSDLTMHELQAEVQKLPQDTIVLLMSFNLDSAGTVYSYDESIARIRSVCPVPIYGVWDFYLGHGIVGGRLTSGFDQGRTAASQVLRILDGERAADIPVVKESPNHFMFDEREMNRFGIASRDLPAGSLGINKESSFLVMRKGAFALLVAALGLLVLAVMIMFIERLEKRRASKELRQEHEIFEGGPVVLFKWVAAEGWPVEYVSGNVSRFGYSEADLTSGKILYADMVVPQDRDRVAREVQEYTEKGVKYFEQRYRIRCADGGVRWIYDITCAIRNDVGEVTHFQGYVLDVTEHREAEERERQLQLRLARSERLESIGKLAGGVAHDLNNILGPLVGYPSLILRELPEDSPVRSCVQEIRNSARRAATVIQDLLALARRGVFEVQPVGINGIVESYLESAAHRMLVEQHPHVKVVKRLDREHNPHVSGSPSHLSRVLMNLVLNAFEAMTESGGELTISTSRGFYDGQAGGLPVEPGDYVTLRVKDGGCGMEPGEIDRIFDPFYTKRKAGRSGTGLGLAVVYGVVKDHMGYIDVKSTPGKGSEFTLYFPEEKNVPAAVAEPGAPRGGTESILVVDDREDQRELCRRLLSSLGYKVVTADGGRAAVEHIRREAVDLVLLDMIMEQGFDGLDTYRAIAEIRPGQKCIIVSGYAETERVWEAQSLGAGGYLRKPYTLARLDEMIRAELDKGGPEAHTGHRRD